MNSKTSDVTPRAASGATTPFLPSTPIDPRKRAEQVREKLVELIREGHLKEGEKLPTEPQLSAMFGVGRSSGQTVISRTYSEPSPATIRWFGIPKKAAFATHGATAPPGSMQSRSTGPVPVPQRTCRKLSVMLIRIQRKSMPRPQQDLPVMRN